ncbi:hypothetical protein ACH4Y0_31910 [Streptomyces sp. NPDC020707]|uniref:Uncharacterized protein n=1 Tax=Streptomyces ortus TaxID=2867268 RepID=A0ABT3VBR7_9ACTN|nr:MULTISPECIES: hypothetical protein [Streptomyces]MCX4236991.1 hypothetical protein [Streptomyces ortus]
MVLCPYGEGSSGLVEYAQGPDQVVQAGPVPSGGDDGVGSHSGAVGQYHVGAVERLHGRDRLDPPGPDGGIGLLLSSLVRGELEGFFLIIMLSLVDTGLQNPVFNTLMECA